MLLLLCITIDTAAGVSTFSIYPINGRTRQVDPMSTLPTESETLWKTGTSQIQTSSDPSSWALGSELVQGTVPNTIEGVEIVAHLPTIPSGLTGNSYYYGEVLTVIFPSGIAFQLAISAYAAPFGTCNAVFNPCYALQYDFQSDGSSCSIDTAPFLRSSGMPQAESWALAIWWNGAHWMYYVGYGSASTDGNGSFSLGLTQWDSGQISSLQSILSAVDSPDNQYIQTIDTRCQYPANSQEFAAMESYDLTATDWQKIGTILFEPNIRYVTPVSTDFPSSWFTAPAAVAIGSGQTSIDANGNNYFGIVGCCVALSTLPFLPYIGGSFQGATSPSYWDISFAGYYKNTTGARFGQKAISDLLWALPPKLNDYNLTPSSIAPSEAITMGYYINNSNGFPLSLGFGASIRPAGIVGEIDDQTNDQVMIVPPGLSWHYRPFGNTTRLAAGSYDVIWGIWSGMPGANGSALLIRSDWQQGRLYVQPLSASAPRANPHSGLIDVGQSVIFSTTAGGGSAGYSYLWQGLPSGCDSDNVEDLQCTPLEDGTFTITVQVTDSYGLSATSFSLSYTIYPDPSVDTPTPSRTSVDIGQQVTFDATASGGAGGYSYSWEGLPGGCSSDNIPRITCIPGEATSLVIIIRLTDSNGYATSSGPLSFVVFPDPSLGIPLGSPTSVDVGQIVKFSIIVSGGSGGYSYVWSGLPTACDGTNSNPVVCTPGGPGTFPITVGVSDSNGYFITSGASSFTVYRDPTISTPVGSPGSVEVGQTVSFAVSVEGGSGGYSYEWFGLPTGCLPLTTNPLSCTPTASGTFSVTAKMVDSNGYAITSDPLAFNVSEHPNPTAPQPGESTPYLAISVVLATLAVIALFVVLRRRRTN